jgi:hypothetical protein
MAPFPAIARLQKSPPRGVMRPALPNLVTGGVALPRQLNVSSPINPSPLREAALLDEMEAMNIDENGGVRLSTTPDGTPPRTTSPKSKNCTIHNASTTPCCNFVLKVGPLLTQHTIEHCSEHLFWMF